MWYYFNVEGDYMNANEIMLLIIIVIAGFMLVLEIYFGYIYLMKKVKNKKVDSIFTPEKLIEEESLMNSMDDKRNIEFKNKDSFTNEAPVKLVENETTSTEQINPFNVDLTKTTIKGRDYIKEEEEKAEKKYFK